MNSSRGMRDKEIPGPVLLTRYSCGSAPTFSLEVGARLSTHLRVSRHHETDRERWKRQLRAIL
jgi:hypothetical protein